MRNLKLPREQRVIATKVRIRMGPGPNQVGLSRAHILDAVAASLRRNIPGWMFERQNKDRYPGGAIT